MLQWLVSVAAILASFIGLTSARPIADHRPASRPGALLSLWCRQRIIPSICTLDQKQNQKIPLSERKVAPGGPQGYALYVGHVNYGPQATGEPTTTLTVHLSVIETVSLASVPPSLRTTLPPRPSLTLTVTVFVTSPSPIMPQIPGISPPAALPPPPVPLQALPPPPTPILVTSTVFITAR